MLNTKACWGTDNQWWLENLSDLISENWLILRLPKERHSPLVLSGTRTQRGVKGGKLSLPRIIQWGFIWWGMVCRGKSDCVKFIGIFKGFGGICIGMLRRRTRCGEREGSSWMNWVPNTSYVGIYIVHVNPHESGLVGGQVCLLGVVLLSWKLLYIKWSTRHVDLKRCRPVLGT